MYNKNICDYACKYERNSACNSACIYQENKYIQKKNMGPMGPRGLGPIKQKCSY